MPIAQALPVQRSRAILSIAGLALSLAGCATRDVAFVTKTSIGIDVDSQSASVAYDRTEGYLAPRFPNKEAVPVFASVATDGKLLDRSVKQVYATGKAARIVSGGEKEKEKETPPTAQQVIFRNASLSATDDAGPRPRDAPAASLPPNANAGASPKKTMFFGTGNVIGFKLGFGPSAAVDMFTFGFKRKEVSFIPHDESDEDLPSVMASLDTGTAAASAVDSKFTVKQFFATGAAAESLAGNRKIQDQFQAEARTRLAQYRLDERSQRDDALTSLICLSKLDDEQARKVWQNAQELVLFKKEGMDKLLAETEVRKARTIYAQEIAMTDATSSTMTGLMRGHAAFVCELTKSKTGENHGT